MPDAICPQSRPLPLVYRPQIKISTLFVAMTTVRIQSVGSSYASRLPARRGKEINGTGDEEAEKQSVWRMKQHAEVRNQENKLKMCCGYLSYRSLLTVLATFDTHGSVHFPLSLGNGRSPHGHINQRLQIQFRAPDDERCAARNMLSLQ